MLELPIANRFLGSLLRNIVSEFAIGPGDAGLVVSVNVIHQGMRNNAASDSLKLDTVTIMQQPGIARSPRTWVAVAQNLVMSTGNVGARCQAATSSGGVRPRRQRGWNRHHYQGEHCYRFMASKKICHCERLEYGTSNIGRSVLTAVNLLVHDLPRQGSESW